MRLTRYLLTLCAPYYHRGANSCSSTELLWCTHLAPLVDREGTVRDVVELPLRDPADQCFLERGMGRLAPLPFAALPRQRVARARYLHQHLVLRRLEIIIDSLPGRRPCWQDPVLETLHDERGCAQLPRDVGVPAVAGERRRAVEAAGRAGGLAPHAPHGIVLHDLVPDLLLSA